MPLAEASCGASIRADRSYFLYLRRVDLFDSLVTLRQQLEDYFHCELNLARGGGGSGDLTRYGVQRSRSVKDIRVCGRGGWGKVGVIKNVKDFRSELHIELL